ncbi:hypothetical protein L7F22_065675 [Adiantum nelumboides]|nr:hypothetical protein [Adiantum nelumboides]
MSSKLESSSSSLDSKKTDIDKEQNPKKAQEEVHSEFEKNDKEDISSPLERKGLFEQVSFVDTTSELDAIVKFTLHPENEDVEVCSVEMHRAIETVKEEKCSRGEIGPEVRVETKYKNVAKEGSLFEYNVYELQFVELWERWVELLRLGKAAPDFLKKDRFVVGLCSPLREKVKERFLVTWMDARDIARLKERKIRYQLQQREADQEEEGMAPISPTNAPTAHRGQGGRGPPPNQEQARGPRRQAQEYHCYNCDENGHGMYYCPHQRRIANYRGPRNQVSPPRETQQRQPPFPIQQEPPVQILRSPVQPQPQQSPPPPPPIAPIPHLPIPENRVVNVISLDAKVKIEEEEKGKSLPKEKGKAKVEEVNAMPIKRARQKEAAMSETGERRKSKEKSNSKKKSKPRRKLTIKDFALGESSQPYNLVDDVSVQGPKIAWPQLLHLAQKVRRQWTKMVTFEVMDLSVT